jgi:hypothetical protein
VAPLTIVLLAQVKFVSGRLLNTAAILLWVSTALGVGAMFILSDFILKNSDVRVAYFAAVIGSPVASAQSLVRFLGAAATGEHATVSIFLCAHLALWIAAGYCFALSLTKSKDQRPYNPLIHAGAISCAALLFPATVGIFNGPDYTVRLLIPYLVCGPLFCLLFVALVVDRAMPSAARQVVWGALTALAGSVATIVALSSPAPIASRLTRCLEGEGLRTGLAEFWDAMPITATSAGRVVVVPFIPEQGVIFRWLTKKPWVEAYEKRMLTGSQFIIITPDLAAKVIDRFGAPDRTTTCEGRSILIYEDAARLSRAARG